MPKQIELIQHKLTHELNLSAVPTLQELADFQMQGQESEDQSNRYYVEAQPAQAVEPNDQSVLFTVAGLEALAAHYRMGKPTMINHERWNSVGYGQTVAASVADKALKVQFYILRDYEPGTGPIHKSNEAIKAIEDGFLKDVSVSVKILRSECSLCGNDYQNYEMCRHWRGQLVRVTDPETGEQTLERCIQIVHDAEALELSLVWNGSDPHAMITDKYLEMSISDPYDMAKMEKVISMDQSNIQSNSPQNTRQTVLSSSAGQQTGGNTMDLETLQAQLKTAQAEKETLEIQKEALQNQCNALQASLNESNAEVQRLKDEASQNESLIEAGREARKELEDKALELFVAGTENCTEEAKQHQQQFLESLASTADVERQIKAWQAIVDNKIPTERQTSDPEGDGDAQEASYTTRRVRY